jgi:asparagine synthase (glutamine-hydrolysing)
MCGIAGFVDKKNSSSMAILKLMTDVLAHRGPDSSGYHVCETNNHAVGFGHRRLSILDLSSLGHQPMTFEHLHIIYNGEVYNFSTIRDELIVGGYSFISETDTEVILKAFHAWGSDCVKKFRGMFAFSIYDSQENKIFIFRDRAGVKPLYYYFNDGLLLFASELKAFYQHPDFIKRINKNVIPLYLQFGYIPAPYSIFENTYKLKPGHFIVFDIKSQALEIEKYWDVTDFYRQDKFVKSEQTILAELEHELVESFKLRMIADVPVGVFLSGGIDSSLITAILQKHANEPIKTFTIGFEEAGYNEANHAKLIAEYLKTDHTEYYCTKQDALNIIPKLAEIYDEPFGDSSAIATLLISAIAKQKVSVVLSGDGGDEIFCGYSKYFALHKTLIFLSPGLGKNLLKLMLNCLNEDLVFWINSRLPSFIKQTNIRDKFQKFKRAIRANNLGAMFIQASSYIDEEKVRQYCSSQSSLLTKTKFNYFSTSSDISPLEQMMMVDFQTFMVDDVLTKVDRATMYSGLEGREPFLDHHIIEYMARVPMEFKYRNGSGKYLLREILYRYVPKNYYEYPKAGFQVPLFEWLKGDLKYLLDHYLNKDRLENGGIFDANLVQKTLTKYYAGEFININEIWFILIFEMWRERWEI